MFISKLGRSIAKPVHGAGLVVRQSFSILKNNPQISLYPYAAAGFILLTSPFISAAVLALWHKVERPEIISEVDTITPPVLLAHLGLVTFSVFYTLFVVAYFNFAVSAETLAKLEGRPASATYGMRATLKHFTRVTKFALLAILFFPLSIIAQRGKLGSPRGIFEVIGSSLSLNMAQLAPTILTKDIGIFETIRHSVDTLGKFWQENLIIKIGMYLALAILASLSFLPKLIEHYWFNGPTAHWVGWIATIFLAVISYVLIKVVGGVFTTVLYHKAQSKT